MSDYQLIVIGSGPGGYVAALRAAQLGMKTAVIEKREAGGTCLNRGCVPTKVLLHASSLYAQVKNGAALGIRGEGVEADHPAIMARKNEVSAKLSSGIESLFKNGGVDFIKGTAEIETANCVRVLGEGEERRLCCEKILIASGSVPFKPPIEGLDLPGVMTSDELLDSVDRAYASVVIIGGGVIGVEFAHYFLDMGSEVTIVEGLGSLLPQLDRDLGANLAAVLKKNGAKIYTNAMVSKVSKSENGLEVVFTSRDKELSASGEIVLCAIGRRACTQGLFADGLQPEMLGPRIKVDEHYETSIKGIFAIGDVSSPIQLAHVASAQGTACAEMMCGENACIRADIVPSCVYCRPEIACVGITEAQAKEAGIAVKVGKAMLYSNARTLMNNTPRSFIKIVAKEDTGVILGAQLMCENSTDMISEFSVAIANKITAAEMLSAMRPHPTFEEAVSEALRDLVFR